MTSQVRSRIEYLIPTYTILMLRQHSNSLASSKTLDNTQLNKNSDHKIKEANHGRVTQFIKI